MSTREYSYYECGFCGWKRKYLKSEDPGLKYCPVCNKSKSRSFYVRYDTEKVKRNKIKKKKK